MGTGTIDEQRAAMLQIAEAIAPGWERRRADIEELATPVREWMLRVLGPRDGDTVLELAAGVGDTGFEAAAIVGISLGQRDHIPPPEPPPAPGPFSMANPERVESLLRDAGFSRVRTEELEGQFGFADADEYLGLIADTSGPIALTLQGLDKTDRAAVRADVEDSLRRFAADGGYELPCIALCAVAS